MKTTFDFTVSNTQLFGQCWQPKTVKSVVVLVHGMGSHSGRFEYSVVPTLVANGYAVVAFDLFGHGQSKGKRGHCPSYEALLQAIDYTIKKAKSLFKHTPVLLYGHSLGGNLVLNYTLRQPHDLKGVIATSPFLKLAFQPPKWKVILGKLILKIAPSITLPSEIESNAISSIKSEVLRYENDKLMHGKISPMYLFPVLEAANYAINNASKITISTLLLHGKSDRIIDYKGTVAFNNNLKTGQLTLFENGFHELHHDTCAQEMLQIVTNWLDNL